MIDASDRMPVIRGSREDAALVLARDDDYTMVRTIAEVAEASFRRKSSSWVAFRTVAS